MAAKAQQSYSINKNIEDICRLLKEQSMYNQLKMTYEFENRGENMVSYRIKHGVTFSSWGETILITLVSTSPETTTITICSECVMPTQIVDWGSNNNNIYNIISFIKRTLSADATQVPLYSTSGAPSAPVRPVAPATSASRPNFCTKCGGKIQPGDRFCAACGSKTGSDN